MYHIESSFFASLLHCFFPTYQVRVVRSYVSRPASFSFSSFSASSSSSSSAGPQLQAIDRSLPRGTRTASTGSECSQPDLGHKESSKIQQTECQKIWHVSGSFLANVAWQLHFNPKIFDMDSTGCSKHVTSLRKI